MKSIKKGFTLVELLFVMAIIAILAGVAIANLKDSTNIAIKNSLRHDIRNFIDSQSIHYAQYQNYALMCSQPNEQQTAICRDPQGNETSISYTKGNIIYDSFTSECVDYNNYEGGASLGYLVQIYNEKTHYLVWYNSCNGGTISEVTDIEHDVNSYFDSNGLGAESPSSN